jgi:hypothetical protein
VIAFLRFRPELLSQFDRDANAFPSPRVLGICIAHSQHGRAGSGFEHELFAGAVGTGAATEFSGFLRMFRELPTIDAILVNPRTEQLPENAATQYAVASALTHCASDSNFDRIRAYLDRIAHGIPGALRARCHRCASLPFGTRGVYTVCGGSEPPRSRLNHP